MELKMTGTGVRREVRFAVVMYGGVSLAIYINGVVQELFRMVRATATKEDDVTPLVPYEDLRGSERVYRWLGQMLGREGEEKNKPWRREDPILTSFVVDILSGSSAGGINAVYLAKALANGQEVDQLSQLWTNEGEIAKLINDEESVKGVDGLEPQRPPRSLLNGHRMYRRLLYALDEMEKGKRMETGAISPYVEELDLFVTATDFYGLPIPLRLADDCVKELRHRNVYQLRYSNKLADGIHNDFIAENNPFLAFAARSTSAFPFAFEPIKLADTEKMLKTAPTYRDLPDARRYPGRWREFFPAYRQRPELLPERAFVDGGYLDNKPFSYAMDALASRDSRVPVDRKLFYVEPSPEHVGDRAQDENRRHDEDRRQGGEVPNAIENVVAALSSLPRYEPIREDLQRILGRNRLVERVEAITSKMEDDVRKGRLAQKKPVREENFGERDLKQMIRTEGVAYGGYHRLKVAAVSDDIARMIARAAGFDAESDEFLAIRYLVRAWREQNYTPYRDEEPDKMTENELLMRYDLAYRLRRLNFVLSRIERLRYRSEETFRNELTDLRAKLNRVLAVLQRTREELERSSPEDPERPGNPLATAMRTTKLKRQDLLKLLEEPADSLRLDKAKVLVGSENEAFGRLASALKDYIEKSTQWAATECQRILNTPGPGEGPQQGFGADARRIVRDYYESYDRYDLISFPILYGTEVGEETDPVEVARVSPEDATCLDKGRLGPRKLAGTAFRSFGAFLDRDWRRNDILWGRLDGAERIIATLLPHADQETERNERIREAQLEILADVLEQPREPFSRRLVDAMTRTGSAEPSAATLRDLAEQTRSGNLPPEEQTLLDSFGANYEVDRRMNRRRLFQTLARSSRVVGGMLEDIAGGGAGRWPAAGVARLGAAFRWLVEASVPGSRRDTLRRRLGFGLLYVFETLLVVVGLFVSSLVALLGLVALIVTAAVDASTLALGDYIRGKRRWRWWLASVVGFVVLTAAAIVLLVVLGAYHLWANHLPV
jgi:patatin-related protein